MFKSIADVSLLANATKKNLSKQNEVILIYHFLFSKKTHTYEAHEVFVTDANFRLLRIDSLTKKLQNSDKQQHTV